MVSQAVQQRRGQLLVVEDLDPLSKAQECSRHIFTEPFPGVLVPYARQTQRLSQILLELAHSSNAEAAARVSGMLGYMTSPDTLIRRQRQEQFPDPSPRVLGVDEFALRRGCTYATILIDLERHRPVGILEGKQPAPLTQWLQDRPGVEILARDRAGSYALAGRVGAPAAVQVADRFHLVHNVGDALKELLRSRRWEAPAPPIEANNGIGGIAGRATRPHLTR
jgi:transposase